MFDDYFEKHVKWSKEELAAQCPEKGSLEVTAENGGPIYELFRAMRMDLMAQANAMDIDVARSAWPRLYLSRSAGLYDTAIFNCSYTGYNYRIDESSIAIHPALLSNYSLNEICTLLAHEMTHAEQYLLGVDLEVIDKFKGKDLNFRGKPQKFLRVLETETNPKRVALIRQAMEVDAEIGAAILMGGLENYRNGEYYCDAIEGKNQEDPAQPTKEQILEGEDYLRNMKPITLIGPQEKRGEMWVRRTQVMGINKPQQYEDIGYQLAEPFSRRLSSPAAITSAVR